MIVWWLARALAAVVCLLVGLWLGLRLSQPNDSISFVRLPGNVTTVIKTKVNTKTQIELRTLPARTLVVTDHAPAQTVVRTHAVRVVEWRQATRYRRHHHRKKHD